MQYSNVSPFPGLAVNIAIAASMLTLRSSEAATIMVAAAIVIPQFTVTLLSPWVGRKAQVWGRKPLLLWLRRAFRSRPLLLDHRRTR